MYSLCFAFFLFTAATGTVAFAVIDSVPSVSRINLPPSGLQVNYAASLSSMKWPEPKTYKFQRDLWSTDQPSFQAHILTLPFIFFNHEYSQTLEMEDSSPFLKKAGLRGQAQLVALEIKS